MKSIELDPFVYMHAVCIHHIICFYMAQVHRTYKALKLMTYSYWLSLETLTADPTLSVVSSTSEIEKRKEK